MPPNFPIAQRDKPLIDAALLRERCAATRPLWIGLEEELMVVDAVTLDLAPRAPQLLARMHGDPRFKLELPAAQMELATTPEPSVAAAADQLALARADLAAAAAPGLRLASAGAHPFAAARGVLNSGERFDEMRNEYGEAAERQLVCGLHVHVAVGDADAAVAVHDALRSYLPELAALAANAPFHEGADTRLASVRPRISSLLPRQGVPPAIGSLDAFADALQWGARSGTVPSPRHWWWALRLHPDFGTVEVRVPDAQATVAHSAAVAGVVQALVARLATRHARGETLPVAPTWRIEENRRTAARFGIAGELADLDSGEREPTAQRLLRLLDEIGDDAHRLGCDGALDTARSMIEDGGPAAAQRRVAAQGDLRDVVNWLADRYGAA